MQEIRVIGHIEAEPARVWSVWEEVERWPEWTPTVTRIHRLSAGPLGEGTEVRIHQPGLRPAVWTITSWMPGLAFTWVSRHPGMTVVAEHRLAPSAGGTEVALTLRFEGWLSVLIAPLVARKTRAFVQQEAEGLKARVEAR